MPFLHKLVLELTPRASGQTRGCPVLGPPRRPQASSGPHPVLRPKSANSHLSRDAHLALNYTLIPVIGVLLFSLQPSLCHSLLIGMESSCPSVLTFTWFPIRPRLSWDETPPSPPQSPLEAQVSGLCPNICSSSLWMPGPASVLLRSSNAVVPHLSCFLGSTAGAFPDFLLPSGGAVWLWGSVVPNQGPMAAL